ncbi:unnamed protein product [Ranitomeya imitator]|uniref:Far11/STRP C-terminal domain-containing protein n=1 Tax=Ranitomeya imitator TaxID=111125 RepID=A0ABN9KZ26_9NEOB|nr:unnamed protein product [Ranitomeya imitator]
MRYATFAPKSRFNDAKSAISQPIKGNDQESDPDETMLPHHERYTTDRHGDTDEVAHELQEEVAFPELRSSGSRLVVVGNYAALGLQIGYREWTAEDCGKVIFSVESPFRLFGTSGKQLIRRRRGYGSYAALKVTVLPRFIILDVSSPLICDISNPQILQYMLFFVFFPWFLSISILEFPSCVVHELPELTAESLESGDNNQFCWRNLFSCINLLRVLNKLTKWKHSRTMNLYYGKKKSS